MSLLYLCVSQGSTVLARHAHCVGNFAEISAALLQRLVEDQPAEVDPMATIRTTMASGAYMFHCLRVSGFVFLAVAEKEFAQERAFRCLERIQNQVNKYGRNNKETRAREQRRTERSRRAARGFSFEIS